MLQVKAQREFYGDERRPITVGEIIEVSEARGRQLIQRGLALAVEPEKASPPPADKREPEPRNKAAPRSPNKAS